MKYIRTKDENNLIIDLTNMLLPYNLTDEYIDFNKFGMFKIVKQADTIEELCDEFVLDHPLFANNCKTLYHSFEKAKNGIKKLSGDAHDLYSFEIFGAIWIKGERGEPVLKAVARMNEKGQLELL